MALKETLVSDMKAALKAGDANAAGLVRLLIAALKNKELEKRAKTGDETLSEEESIKIVQGEAKKRREAIALFKTGGREDLVKKEEAELTLIARYIPKLMGKDETATAVREYLARTKPANLPTAMKGVMQELKGKADTAIAAECVKAHFSSSS